MSKHDINSLRKRLQQFARDHSKHETELQMRPFCPGEKFASLYKVDSDKYDELVEALDKYDEKFSGVPEQLNAPRHGEPRESSKPSEAAMALLRHAKDCGGLEVHRDQWHLTKELVEAGLGEVSVARGPGRVWVRLTPTEAARTRAEFLRALAGRLTVRMVGCQYSEADVEELRRVADWVEQASQQLGWEY